MELHICDVGLLLNALFCAKENLLPSSPLPTSFVALNRVISLKSSTVVCSAFYRPCLYFYALRPVIFLKNTLTLPLNKPIRDIIEDHNNRQAYYMNKIQKVYSDVWNYRKCQ